VARVSKEAAAKQHWTLNPIYVCCLLNNGPAMIAGNKKGHETRQRLTAEFCLTMPLENIVHYERKY